MLVSLLDMCRYGMTSTDKDGEAPVRKITRIVTNVPEISQRLSARCQGGGVGAWFFWRDVSHDQREWCGLLGLVSIATADHNS